MNNLGYEKSERSDKDDYRNGYKPECINSSVSKDRIPVLYRTSGAKYNEICIG